MISIFATQSLKCGDIVYAFDRLSKKTRPFMVLSNAVVSDYYRDSVVLCTAITHSSQGQGFRISVCFDRQISYIRTDRDAVQSLDYNSLSPSGASVKENIVALVMEGVMLSIGFTNDEDIIKFKEKLEEHNNLIKASRLESKITWGAKMAENKIEKKIGKEKEKKNKEMKIANTKEKKKRKQYIFVDEWEDEEIKDTYDYIKNHTKKECMGKFNYKTYSTVTYFERRIVAEMIRRNLLQN